jgi:BirA family biotin operon repressor/biotin-[acetyl-CoA-carboxylase] ligase
LHLPRLTALGALAAKEVLHQQYGLPARIKWPNDILIEGNKLGGVLVEMIWDGTRVEAAVIGIGLNVALDSAMLANQFAAEIPVPATSIEAVSGVRPDRMTLLKRILEKFIAWRSQITSKMFHAAWENSLAYQGEWVQVISAAGGQPYQHKAGNAPPHKMAEGYIIGLSQDGSLRLQTASGQIVTVSAGEVHLRPAGDGHPSGSVFQASTKYDGEC